jgi:hypothetical protein
MPIGAVKYYKILFRATVAILGMVVFSITSKLR